MSAFFHYPYDEFVIPEKMLENAKFKVISNVMKRFQAPIHQHKLETRQDIEDKQIHNESAYLFVSQFMMNQFFLALSISISLSI